MFLYNTVVNIMELSPKKSILKTLWRNYQFTLSNTFSWSTEIRAQAAFLKKELSITYLIKKISWIDLSDIGHVWNSLTAVGSSVESLICKIYPTKKWIKSMKKRTGLSGHLKPGRPGEKSNTNLWYHQRTR